MTNACNLKCKKCFTSLDIRMSFTVTEKYCPSHKKIAYWNISTANCHVVRWSVWHNQKTKQNKKNNPHIIISLSFITLFQNYKMALSCLYSRIQSGLSQSSRYLVHYNDIWKQGISKEKIMKILVSFCPFL